MMNAPKSLIPAPQSAAFSGGRVRLSVGARPRFTLHCEEGADVLQTARLLIQQAVADAGCAFPEGAQSGYPITIRIDPADPRFAQHKSPEAYALTITEGRAELVGCGEGGALYAAVTFAALVEDVDGSAYVSHADIVDWPDFPVRCLFLEDRYGSDFMTLNDYERAIEQFARMKYNCLTVGVYGCWCQQYDRMISEYLYIPFENHPNLQTPRHVKYYSVEERKWIYKRNVLPVMFEQDYFGSLVALGKKWNIEIKPLFNSYGHNTLIPRMFPETSARDIEGKPTGFGVCPSSEETYELMFSLYDEIIDRYLKPNDVYSIHIGMDEVWEGIGMDAIDPKKHHTPFCQCAACRGRSRGDLMVDYIVNLLKYFKCKGMKNVYIYYDMLFNAYDKLNAAFAERLRAEDVYDIAVIDWWDYSGEDMLFFGKKLNSLFRSVIKPITGYYHWSTPVEYLSNIRGCMRLAKEYGFDGVDAYSSYDDIYDRSYRYLADLSWNYKTVDDQDEFLSRYARLHYPHDESGARAAMDAMGTLMSDNFMSGQMKGCTPFKLDYYLYTYVRAEKPYPRDFPDEVFAQIAEQRAGYTAELERIRASAEKSLRFFEEQEGLCRAKAHINRTWLAMALHFYTVANEYLNLLAMEDALVAGEMDAAGAVKSLNDLIIGREQLMRRVEGVRIEANLPTYMRNLTIYRQILIDLRAAAAKCAENGTAFSLDLTNLTDYKTETLAFLR